MRRDYSLLVALSLLSICSIFGSITTTTSAFEWSSGGGKPQVTRQAIAGLWRLTPQPTYPLKEFTVHPPPQPKDQINQQNKQLEDEDVLLMLKEDGSFQQYLNDDEEHDEDMEEEDEDVDDQWSRFQQKQKNKQLETTTTSDKSKQDDPASLALKSSPDQLVKGVWDFRDGKLILAADRPDEATASSKKSTNQQPKQNRPPKQQQQSSTSQRPHLDKLIVGRVVATYESSLQDNPILLQQQNATAGDRDALQPKPTTQQQQQQQNDDIQKNAQQSSASSSTSGDKTDTTIDAHLSVPKGSLKVGKFFYPKNHPSFFEQPIYNPTTAHRRFQLKQVLGTLNTAKQQQEEGLQPEQMFERRDFYNKTFLLTAHPLKQRTAPPPRDEDKMPWLKNNNNKRPDETINPLAESARIRVMQVKFFPNNTFCSLWGTGDAILRGRFDVFEKEVYGHWTTNFWMQVLRFGLGRSVSGSVYSEGRSLTHEDAKTYWGTKLRRINVTTTATTTTTGSDEDGKASDDNQPSTTSPSSEALLEVEGSVMYGGVGAEPVGRFLMREMMEEELALQEDDDEEEDDDDDDDDNDDDGEYDSLLDGSSSSLPRFWTDNDDDDKNNNDKDMDWLSDENAFQ